MSAALWSDEQATEAERRMDANLPLTLLQAAWVLNLTNTKGAHRGAPSRERVLSLVARGSLRVVDPEQFSRNWTVSPAELRRYMAGPEGMVA